MIGQTLGQYEILSLLGKGGMGEVYRARDTRLAREVALKLLPPSVAQDAERLARFEREARTLASLQHANIATLYGFEEADGQRFLVMELVEGEELADRIARGPLRLDEAREIALQMAAGIEAAHARGIVHRDLKPANVRLTPDGQVKVLDFGLARAYTGTPDSDSDIHNSPTITAAMTQAGTILGTAAYMSPEQARGRSIDHRADVWAFGVILHEMLTGRRLFEGETISDTLANVLKSDVDLGDVAEGLPPNVHRVLARCLERDPRQRLHAIADARIELETDEAPVAPTPAGTAASGSGRLAWSLVGLLVVATFLAMIRPWETASDAVVRTPRALSVNIPEEAPLNLIDWAPLKVSADGKWLATTNQMEGRTAIMLRANETGEVREVTPEGNAFSVFFSPDSKNVGYYSENRIHRVGVEGGAPTVVTESSHPRGATWSDDGWIYFSPGYTSGLERVREDDPSTVEEVTRVDHDKGERTHRWPSALPDGRGVAFTIGGADSPGDYEDARIAIYDAQRGTVRELGVQGARVVVVDAQRLLVARRGVLFEVRLDSDLEVVGAPRQVFEGVQGDPASGMYYFDIDAAGNLYYVPSRAGGVQRRLAWVERDGDFMQIGPGPGRYRYPRLSEDEETVLMVLGEGHGNNDDVYLLRLDDYSQTRLTFDQDCMMPQWMPGGRAVLFNSVGRNAMVVRELGRDAAERTIQDREDGVVVIPTSVGRDGRTVLAIQLGSATVGDVVGVDLEDSTGVQPLAATEASEWGGRFSPDMEWFVYCSDEAGREEIFVQPYPPTGAKWQVSTDGGRGAMWSKDGREIFWVRGDQFFAAAVSTEPEFRAQRPQKLFDHPMDSSGVPLANYDVTADGQRFLVVQQDANATSDRIDVVLNWLASIEE